MLTYGSGKHIAVFRAVALVLSGPPAYGRTGPGGRAHDQLVAGKNRCAHHRAQELRGKKIGSSTTSRFGRYFLRGETVRAVNARTVEHLQRRRKMKCS